MCNEKEINEIEAIEFARDIKATFNYVSAKSGVGIEVKLPIGFFYN